MNNISFRIRERVRGMAPACWRDASLDDDLPLGKGGVGLDSIAILELLLACEAEFGVPFREELLQKKSLTVGNLVEYVSGARDMPETGAA